MKPKADLIWGISLTFTGICSLVICLSAVGGNFLPVWLVRTLGVILVVCVPVVVFTTVRYLMSLKREDGRKEEKADDTAPQEETDVKDNKDDEE